MKVKYQRGLTATAPLFPAATRASWNSVTMSARRVVLVVVTSLNLAKSGAILQGILRGALLQLQK